MHSVGMAGGNQRDKAREKTAKKQKEAQKKQSSGEKDGNKGMSLEERRQRYLYNCQKCLASG